VRSSKQSDLKD